MESDRPYGGGERGAGGKFRKPPSRKPPSTPYDRPTVNQSAQRRPTGWLSRLVDPAYRLITGGASKLVPSLFSRLPSVSSTGNHETEAIPNSRVDDNRASDSGTSRSGSEAGPSNVVDVLEKDPASDELRRDNMKTPCDDSDIRKIEQLVKGRMFSRDEFNRLVGILNSNAVPDVEREKERPSLTAEEGAKPKDLLSPEYARTPVEGKKDVSKIVSGISSAHIETNMQDEVTASPIDIARAYMGRRTSELGPGSYNVASKSERPLYKGVDIHSNQFIPPTSPKASPCWPGAMVQEQRGYTTPLSQRGTFRSLNFPRTPYSRTSNSKSKANLTRFQSESSLNISSSPLQQPRPPIFGQVKIRSDMDNGYGSVGAIRRVRNRFATETPRRGSASLYSMQKSPLQLKESNASKVFFPVKEKNVELGGTSGTSNDHSADNTTKSSEGLVPTPNLSASPAVKGILEHLLSKPTPHDLAAELKIATQWKKSPSTDTDVMQNVSASTNFAHFGGSFDLRKNTDGFKSSAEGTGNRETSNSVENSYNSGAINGISKASGKVNGNSGIQVDGNAGPSFGFNNVSNFVMKNTDQHNGPFGAKEQQKDTSQFWPLHKQVNGQDFMRATKEAEPELLKKPTSNSSPGTKPVLKSILVNKWDPKRIISSENGPGFTFPVSSSGVFSEPPTPSIMPSFSSGGQPKEDSPAPSYTFGTKESHPRLDFSSFPSTSNASNHDGASDLKFDFGSKKARVSFKSVGKDAICF